MLFLLAFKIVKSIQCILNRYIILLPINFIKTTTRFDRPLKFSHYQCKNYLLLGFYLGFLVFCLYDYQLLLKLQVVIYDIFSWLLTRLSIHKYFIIVKFDLVSFHSVKLSDLKLLLVWNLCSAAAGDKYAYTDCFSSIH